MSRTVRAVAGIPVPHLEIVLGGIAWVAGTLALPAGTGTVLMAAGLGITGALWVSVRRRHGLGARLDRELRTRVLRLGVGVVVALVVLGVALPLVGGWGELTVPLGCAVVGVALFPLSSLLGERSFVALGGLLVVLGAVGALLALNSAGATLPQGVVGIGGGLLLWLAGSRRIGLFGELRSRVGR
ncbi:MAG: hypothetical protein OJJ54_16535 [Pseudonocardia sp.]|nr:hypothetical protein [Pseudonocardia sp.]